MPIGRNDPCPCDSGKKYKKCCFLKEYVPVGRDESIKKRLVQEILAFVKKNYKDRLDDALDLFWGDFVAEDYLDSAAMGMADINFWEWVVFDWQPFEDGKSTIDLFIKANKGLTPDETSILKKMNVAVISLYEVQEVYPERGLLLKDLVLGGKYEVSEKAATRSLSKWGILATRLLLVDGKYIMSGCGYPYLLSQKERMLDFTRGDYEDYKQDYPNADLREYLKDNSNIFNYYWYDLFQNPRIPKLFTTTGEPMLFCKAIFDIKDREAVVSGLKTIRGIEQDEYENFIWVDKPDEDEGTVLGTIALKDRRLRLQCNSKERLETGKKMISEALSDIVTHRADEYEDPAQAIKAHKDKSVKPGGEIPLEIQQELYTQHMRKHYENWLTDKIPALGGKTPMESIKTKAGKVKVIELLKGIENIEEGNRKADRPYIDVSWMWERLGLKETLH